MNIELIIENISVDMYRNANLTLNYNNSIFGDISAIRANNTQTLALPRTKRNDRVFQFASSPSIDGNTSHQILSCRCYIDGVTIFDNGRCFLLRCDADKYEISITWGVFHQDTNSFLNEKYSLSELKQYDEDYISWNVNSGVTVLEGGVSQIENAPNGTRSSMFYKQYDYTDGAEIDKSLINLHPCVSLLEIWERIRRENNLKLQLDRSICQDMENRFIVLVKNKDKQLQNYKAALTLNGTPGSILPNIYDNTNENKRSLIFGFSGSNIDRYYDRLRRYFKSYGDGSTSVQFGSINVQYEDEQFIRAVNAYPQNYVLEIRYNGVPMSVQPVVNGNTLTYNISDKIIDGIFDVNSTLSISMLLSRWEGITDEDWYSKLGSVLINDFYIWMDSTITVRYQLNTASYPLPQFRLVPNLPNISQIDFINFICRWYGLFPVQDNDAVRFASYSSIMDNIDNGNYVDWSDKLISLKNDAPLSISFAMGSYARRNIIGYTVDDNDVRNIVDEAYIEINDTTLDREKDLIIFPFSATYRNIIPQYRQGSDGKIEKIECDYRLMGHDDSGGLFFNDDMKSSYIVKTSYSAVQSILHKPKVIEENMILSLIDIVSLDSTKPIYIAKYGRYFVADNIQWSSSDYISKVKLILIR